MRATSHVRGNAAFIGLFRRRGRGRTEEAGDGGGPEVVTINTNGGGIHTLARSLLPTYPGF